MKPKQQTITINVTPKQKQQFHDFANSLGISLSTLVRILLTDQVRNGHQLQLFGDNLLKDAYTRKK